MKTKIKTLLKENFNIVKQDILSARKSVKQFPMKLYKMIDKGDPSWLSLFGLINISLTIPIKYIHKKRRKSKYLLSFLPDYYNLAYDMCFLHTNKILENSNAVLELKKLKTLMESHGFVKDSKITSDEDVFRSSYTHNKHGQINMFIYIDDFCDIEYVDVVKQEPVMIGMCAKVLEELNSN